MSLTDTAIRNAKPLDKSWKLSDAQGLYLLIKPNGSKLWHLKYRFGGKEKKLAFGAYPAVSLANARKLREDARSVLSAGSDPGVKKQQEKFARKSGNTFEDIVFLSSRATKRYRSNSLMLVAQLLIRCFSNVH